MDKAWLITVKVPKNPDHNPRDKKSGPCPVNGKPCTDVTGEHHTYLMRMPDFLESSAVQYWVDKEFGLPVTRVEEIEL